ncbi:hypothetical protein [Streptomyces djakartensis]|uniref:Uncharacterized protein n=1 Tax=Streptomyces djakartensis TaxID=68193 RepID=A0ABQ3A7T4_9ACTN|nr:hypothetical protein [Streptomyces djakartensis]GGY35688.1 hypothetical protein GCM10010384_48670 [Streptomyces djakartensis]
MDLRGVLRRTAMSRPAVLAVTLPGATELRLEAEAEVRRRGWPVAHAPAAADLLLVCGDPAPEDAEWLDGIERSMPEPALRIVAGERGRIAAALDVAREDLRDRTATRRDSSPPEASGDRRHDHHRMDHGQSDHAAQPGHEEHGHHQPADHQAHMDHMDHMGHDMHAMGEVAGLPMAERGDDRDELRLDQLHVPIGPALSDWPTGLILRLTLQGDVVQVVEVDHLPVPLGPRLPFWGEPWLRAARGEEVTRGSAARRRCAAHLDSAGRLLAVVGWDDAAARCRRLRDEVLPGASREGIGGDLRRMARRIGRSRPLRWSIAGLGELPADRARAAGVTGPSLAADGDAYDRLLMWLSEIERGLEELDDTRPLAPDDLTGPRGRLDGPRPPSRALLDVLPELLTGAEFACARIIVASLDPDLDELALAPVPGVAHA